MNEQEKLAYVLAKLEKRFADWPRPEPIERRPLPSRADLLAAKLKKTARKPVAGRKLSLKCPDCKSGNQTIRQNKTNLQFFLGCSSFPTCRWSSDLPDHMKE